MNNTSDPLHRFLFDNTDIRGEIVTLEKTIEDICSIQNYPPAIATLLGEFLTAAALLSSTLKFDGTLSLQARGDGDLPLIMAEVNHQKKIRGVAQYNNANTSEERSLKSLLGNGILSIVINPDKGEQYQGIVALEGENLAQCLESYFMQSEQLPTRIWLCSNGQKASGMLLQRLPQQVATESINNDAWETQIHLANTLSTEELLNLGHLDVLTRLFHETNIRVFDPEPIAFSCSCSKERSSRAIERLGQEELQAILKEEGKITVDCHFCGFQYNYFSNDIAALFAPDTQH